MEQQAYIPWHERINVTFLLTVLVFVVVVLTPIGYVGWNFLDTKLSGGVKHLSDGTVQVDLKSMSSFVFDQVNGTINDVPANWRELNGKKVVLKGEIWAPQAAGPNVDRFQLCYSIAKCCFSGPPQVQHFVDARVEGGAVPYFGGLVKVTGTLTVDVQRDPEGGKVSSVYQLKVENIEPI